MTDKQIYIKYSEFSYDDFLNDDFFINSKNNPTRESSEFWNLFESSTPINIEEYNKALLTLSLINKETEKLSESDNLDLWNHIETSISIKKNKRRKGRNLLIISTIAASILIILLALPKIFVPDRNINTDISLFAKETKSDYNSTHNTQLILSTDKTVELKEKESDIQYNTEEIKANGQGIPKEEISNFNQLIVPRGKRSQIKLSDGSHLYVNSGTRVIYPASFDSEIREIYVDGEIYIDVVSDGRPFWVKTDKMAVEVLGTRFNVMSYENENTKRVTLVQGKIKITGENHEPTIVSPSMMYELKDGISTLQEVDVNFFTSWMKGIHYYQSNKLEEIIIQLSRYYGAKIECEDDVKNYVCSGKIDINDPLDKVLENIAYVLPIKVEKMNDNLYQIKMNK